jgi:altronate hydrolase
MKQTIQIHPHDNVAVALRDFAVGETFTVGENQFVLTEEVKRGHKIALKPIEVNENVVKYGYPIGHAIEAIEQGKIVHTHNVKTNLNDIMTYEYQPIDTTIPYPKRDLTFKGYRRKTGEVGIRNELWIVPSVGCVNGIADLIIREFENEVGDIAPFESTLVLKHNFGCSQLGDDHENTRTILMDAIKHPNAAGVLVLGLGCENNTIQEIIEELGDYDTSRIKFLISQQVEDEVEAGVKALVEIHQAIQGDVREDIPLRELRIGLKCGGSDGLSGITANPLLGRFSDFLVAQGGTTVLTEVPEMFGAETILMNRAKDEETFENIVSLINDFKQYFIDHNQPIYENPSPGNKAGGISTLEDKSLGCTQKAGQAQVVDVLKYGERLSKPGLNLLSAPGNDLVACTALASAGCQLVLFTTGRGTPFGSFVPTMKISTNSAIYNQKKHWIDFNAGQILEEDTNSDDVLEQFIQYIIEVASGKQLNHERNNFKEMSIFKSGVTL